jgi:hypothetical protein
MIVCSVDNNILILTTTRPQPLHGLIGKRSSREQSTRSPPRLRVARVGAISPHPVIRDRKMIPETYFAVLSLSLAHARASGRDANSGYCSVGYSIASVSSPPCHACVRQYSGATSRRSWFVCLITMRINVNAANAARSANRVVTRE